MTGAQPRRVVLGEREERDQIIQRDLGRLGAEAGQLGVRQEPHRHATHPRTTGAAPRAGPAIVALTAPATGGTAALAWFRKGSLYGTVCRRSAVSGSLVGPRRAKERFQDVLARSIS